LVGVGFFVGLDWLIFRWIGLVDFSLDWIGWFFRWIGLVGLYFGLDLIGLVFWDWIRMVFLGNDILWFQVIDFI
jgi:hypothetical protein